MWKLPNLPPATKVPVNDVFFRVLLKDLSAALADACGHVIQAKGVEIGDCTAQMFEKMPESSAVTVLTYPQPEKKLAIAIPGDSMSVAAEIANSTTANIQEILLAKVVSCFNRFSHEVLRKPDSFKTEVQILSAKTPLDEFLKSGKSLAAIQFLFEHDKKEFLIVALIEKSDIAWLFEKVESNIAPGVKSSTAQEGGKTILIVDDNHNVRSILVLFLSHDGYVVKEAASADAALKILSSCKVDLIVLDIMMRPKDGFEFCKELKADEKLKGIPVIFCSAKSQREDVIKAIKAGGIDYIVKPFTKNTLLRKIKAHIG